MRLIRSAGSVLALMYSDVEKLLITATQGEREMTDKDRGLLILAVGNLRKWAAGLRTSDRGVSLDTRFGTRLS